MNPTSLEAIATVLFAIAILHTFSVKSLQHLALSYPEGSVGENFFHLMGEVEIVFGLWAAVLISAIALFDGANTAIQFVESRNFTEPAFVFVVMTVAASRPILRAANLLLKAVSRILPLPRAAAFYVSVLAIGPLLGSFITEPAAMTVCALVLKSAFFDRTDSLRFKYLSLAVLFVNISIGGVLTHFAAPPVLMVASTWNWNSTFMLTHLGWKAIIAVSLNTLLALTILRTELKKASEPKADKTPVPAWLIVIHLAFLALIVTSAHHPVFTLGVFLFFIGVTQITQEYQDELKLKESLLVGFFLGGLVVLGGMQQWWLKPLIDDLTAFPLFLGTTLLTAVMDNAALTYLGAQVPDITDALKYALVAGAVSGGGLTVIANAPNPAGFAILKDCFGPEGISPIGLFINALPPTLIAMLCFWLLPRF